MNTDVAGFHAAVFMMPDQVRHDDLGGGRSESGLTA